jgi:hypothetical protein
LRLNAVRVLDDRTTERDELFVGERALGPVNVFVKNLGIVDGVFTTPGDR